MSKEIFKVQISVNKSGHLVYNENRRFYRGKER